MAATRRPGSEIKTGSISFPIPELTKVMFSDDVYEQLIIEINKILLQAMNMNEHEKIGQLVLPLNDQSEKQPIPVLLDMKDLRHLHGIMFPST